jgi:hypothetical protein
MHSILYDISRKAGRGIHVQTDFSCNNAAGKGSKDIAKKSILVYYDSLQKKWEEQSL